MDDVLDPAKLQQAENPTGFSSPEAYNEFIRVHKQVFAQKTRAKVPDLVGTALKDNTRIFFGGTAIVNLSFGSNGKLSRVVVDSISPELKAFLEEISWSALQPPAAYSLSISGVQIEFTVLQGFLNFRINTL